MDFYKPELLLPGHFKKKFYKPSKENYTTEVTKLCQDKEDLNVCIEKHTKAFDLVFDTLEKRLMEEDWLSFKFDRRLYDGQGVFNRARFEKYTTGYEQIWEGMKH